MAEATTDSSGTYAEPGMREYDCRLTVCYMGKCKTVYIADGFHDMKETAQVYVKRTMLELEAAASPPKETINTVGKDDA